MQYVHKENFKRLFGERALRAAHVLNQVCFEIDEHSKGALSKFVSRSDGLPHREFLVSPSLHTLIDLRSTSGSAQIKLARDIDPSHPEKSSIWVTIFLSPTEYLGCNLESVLNGRPSDAGKCSVYQHCLLMRDDSGQLPNNRGSEGSGSYVGMTRRCWQDRWNEHQRSARQGSPYLFHDALRSLWRRGGIVKHIVVGSGLDFDEAMKLEEETVADCSLRPLGFNMIPGGFAGLRYLAEHGIRVTEKNIENRDSAIGQYLQDNPAIAKLWLDPEYAQKCICGWGNRLTVAQVRAARAALKSGSSISSVAELVAARNIAQIARLASSKTYRRILQ